MKSLIVLFACVLVCSSLAIKLPKPYELKEVSESEMLVAGLPTNVCPDYTFKLYATTYNYYCYQPYRPVEDPNALPWCPNYAVSTLFSIGVYSLTSNNMKCPGNTNHTVSTLDFAPPASTNITYDFCFYSIPIFPQQSKWTSYCYDWADPSFTTGIGYSFVWTD